MSSSVIRGVVPILVTPFHPDGSIDEESLASLIDYNIAAGVHGLGVALGSEVFKFNEAERAQITRLTIKAVNGRVPVIINSGANGTDLAVFYSKAAEAAGADALMIIPPGFWPASPEEIFDYYQAIDRAVGIPIILQDVPQGPVSPGLALRLADACPNVKYIKVLTIFGGAGGSYFIEEMRRGADGTMPFCSQPDDFVAVWDAFQRGDEATARTRFDATIMAINRLGNQGGDVFYHIHKQLLVRRGIIRGSLVRSPTTPPDAITQREIDELLAQIVPTPVAFRG